MANTEHPRTPDTSAPRDLPTVTVKVNGQPLARRYDLLAVRVQKEANRIPTAHLVFKDGDPATATFAVSSEAGLVPGQALEVWAGYHGQEALLFRGLIVRHGIEGRTSGTTRLVLTAKDAFVKTTLAPRRRYYYNQPDSAVAEDIVGQYPGLGIEAEATAVQHAELLQYDATDWDFLVMRAEANGQLCLVDDATLHLRRPDPDQAAVTELQYGATILDFDAEMDARDQPPTLRTTAWNYADQAVDQASAAEPPAGQLGNFSADDLAGALATDLTLQHGGHLGPEELQAWADAALLKRRLGRIRGRVRFYGNAAVKPGTVVGLAGLGERFSGKAYVTGVSHRLEDGAWLTDVQFGLDPRWFAAEAAVSPPPAAGLLPPALGLQIGVVTALANDPAGEERIAVRLPVVDATADGTRARVLSLDAGPGRGFYFRPEIGDEVVVGFLHHDPRQAVVLGALHSSRHPIPGAFATADANPRKGYVSRANLQVLFDDDKKTLTLATPAGNALTLDDDARRITLQDQHGNKLVLDAEGITLESRKALTLKAATDATLAGVNVEHTAQAQFKATGAGGAEVSSGATAVLKGSLVMIN